MISKYCELFHASPIYVIITLCLVLSSCEDKSEEPFIAGPLAIVDYQEIFEGDNEVYLKARFATLDIDTIQSFGFSYKEVQRTLVNPIPNTDFTVEASALKEEKGVSGGYYFEVHINPERSSPTFYESTYVLPVCAYIKSKNGKIWVSETLGIYGDKLKILDVYPQHSAPGTVVRARLSRDILDGQLLSINPNTRYDLVIEAGGKQISIDKVGNNLSIYFKMPSGLTENTPLKVKVQNYEHEYGSLKNTDKGFTKLTELNRPSYDQMFFAFPDNIYIGGGSSEINGPVLTDFHKFNVSSGSWSLIADYPADAYPRGYTYIIGEFAYCGYPQNLHQYNSANNTWSKVPLPTNELKYDYKFTTAATVVHNGEAYLNSFEKAVTVNGFYWNNFFKFNHATQKYAALKAYPGSTLTSQFPYFCDKGVSFNGKIHFLRRNQHWVYDPTTTNWSQLNDVTEGARDVKVFSYKGSLYCIVAKTIPGGFLDRSGTSLTLLRYNQSSDTWTKDADLPRSHEDFENHIVQIGYYPISASNDEFYFVLNNGSKYSIYALE